MATTAVSNISYISAHKTGTLTILVSKYTFVRSRNVMKQLSKSFLKLIGPCLGMQYSVLYIRTLLQKYGQNNNTQYTTTTLNQHMIWWFSSHAQYGSTFISLFWAFCEYQPAI